MCKSVTTRQQENDNYQINGSRTASKSSERKYPEQQSICLHFFEFRISSSPVRPASKDDHKNSWHNQILRGHKSLLPFYAVFDYASSTVFTVTMI
mmetsp:Transcript_2908/g.3940  ORF Transcript_2908/g.3940 Transcript_2908/m.3940 type:complete len:95 (-) Transcript_2908:548-832(-)